MAYPPEVKKAAQAKRALGWSVREIEAAFGVSRGTASLWCRGVALTENGTAELERKRGLVRGVAFQGGQGGPARTAASEAARRKREAAFAEGYKSQPTAEDALCVGLYWGEGAKKSGTWRVCNSERALLALMVRWAIRAGQPRGHFRAQVALHPEDTISDEGAAAYWAKIGVPPANITVRRGRTSSSKKVSKRRLPCGVCTLSSAKNGVRLFQYYLGQRAFLTEVAG